MKQIIVMLIFCLPFLSKAQSDTSRGIKWAEGLAWVDVLQKAKAEHKYIFLDCYATWCGPCHLMDKDVYPNEEVGQAVNDKFISVKVQMDKTNYDNDAVKKWYTDAKFIEKNYAITAFPTFLFFSPEGKPLHRAVGYREPSKFVSLTKDALNPNKQYYALLENYKPGRIDTAELKGLARVLKNLGGGLAQMMAVEYLNRIPKQQLSNPDNLMLMMEFGNNYEMQKMATAYIFKLSPKAYSKDLNFTFIRVFNKVPTVSNLMLNYLKGLKKEQLAKQLQLLIVFNEEAKAKLVAETYFKSLKNTEIYTKDNITFIKEFTKNSKDLGFRFFKENVERIDKTMGYKYAHIVTENVIIREEYQSYYEDAVKAGIDNIPWEVISKTISDKYGRAMAFRLDLHVRAKLYANFAKHNDKYWPEYIKYYIENIDKIGYDTTHPQVQFLDVMQLNNFVFDAIFYHSNDTGQMKIGLRWMEGVLRRNPTEANNTDTYANLLFKLGRKEEAIQWEEKAVSLASADKNQEHLLPSLKQNLSKMQKGIPTWIKEN